MYVLRITESDYPINIVKLFLALKEELWFFLMKYCFRLNPENNFRSAEIAIFYRTLHYITN